jgi:hypothetical protein
LPDTVSATAALGHVWTLSARPSGIYDASVVYSAIGADTFMGGSGKPWGCSNAPC